MEHEQQQRLWQAAVLLLPLQLLCKPAPALSSCCTPAPGMLQGLLIYNADGTLMHEESLSQDLCHKIIQLAKDCGEAAASSPPSLAC